MSSPLCCAPRERAEGGLTRPDASEESVAPRGSPRCAQQPRRSRRDQQYRSAWSSPVPLRNRHKPPSSDHRTAARFWGDAPSALPDLLRRTPGEVDANDCVRCWREVSRSPVRPRTPRELPGCLPRCTPPHVPRRRLPKSWRRRTSTRTVPCVDGAIFIRPPRPSRDRVVIERGVDIGLQTVAGRPRCGTRRGPDPSSPTPPGQRGRDAGPLSAQRPPLTEPVGPRSSDQMARAAPPFACSLSPRP
jgi:hypothetical protein